MEVTTDEVKREIGKKCNWSGAGRDKIKNFWWKKLTDLHKHIASVFETLINEERDIDGPTMASDGRDRYDPEKWVNGAQLISAQSRY